MTAHPATEAASSPMSYAEGAAALMTPIENETPQADAEAQEPAGDEPAPEIQAEDTPEGVDAVDDAPTEQQDEPAPPAIDPPVSWAADAKDKFAELPPALQEFVSKRESERERFVQSKAQEAAEARKVVQTIQTQAEALQQQFQQAVQQFLPEIPAEPDPAWLNTAVYGDEGPQTFYAHKAAREAALAQHHKAQQVLAVDPQAARQREVAELQDIAKERDSVLSDPEKGLPGWSDPTTRAQIDNEITRFALDQGIDPESLVRASGAEVLILHRFREAAAKAEKWDKLQKDKMAVVRQAKELPKVAKPGAPGSVNRAVQAATADIAVASFRHSRDAGSAAALLYERKR